ncbi:hypothetical protein [Acinetobacter terrae]|jgi:hypothetical protein|uniref:Uncharacterized protein n=2 Tax=Acinetobacter terrae TaxID=2731247 RepID=A0A4R0ENZ5_9GAMM|nr:hypothetical protein [Acinetobacter terrae]OAL75987.1 hypothetical protein AY608_09920 [Acinetobacter terrae]TCB60709.1 hypothetical protein E0H85_05400 [Acinetobacter terrae]
MRIAAVIFQYACFAFALFLCYQIATSIYLQDYQLMDIVSDVGSILICIDLAMFLHFNKSIASIKIKGTSQQSPVQVSTVEKVSRKLGHLGIMLIICSWIVPKLA